MVRVQVDKIDEVGRLVGVIQVLADFDDDLETLYRYTSYRNICRWASPTAMARVTSNAGPSDPSTG